MYDARTQNDRSMKPMYQREEKLEFPEIRKLESTLMRVFKNMGAPEIQNVHTRILKISPPITLYAQL